MKKKHQIYFRLNLMSLFLIAISFISVTLAWFAYSGIATVDTSVDVKAWYIELEKDGEKVSNEIVISLSDIYPGMEPKTELININNPGDSDAELKYNIVSARILGDSSNNYIVNESVTTEYIEDLLSHEFPFNINMNLDKKYILSKGEGSTFEISISWPLDSGNDIMDSEWGNKAYNFQKEEIDKKNQDSSYIIQSSIQIQISLTAEQYLANSKSSDPNFNLGDEILIDVINNNRCTAISPTCIKMYVIDVNNTLGDANVNLLPNPYGTYLPSTYYDYTSNLNTLVSSWQVNTRALLLPDLLQIISNDVNNSFLIRNELSNTVIGNLKFPDRITTEINKAITNNGYYSFLNDKYNYLTSADCYWIQSNYNDEEAFAIIKENEINSKIFNNIKDNTCKVIPVVSIEKNKLI